MASGTATWSNVFWGQSIFPPNYADIYTSTVSGLNVDIGAGTYWLELSKGLTALFNWVYWDNNEGPSKAYISATSDSIGSEAFTVYGTTAPIPGTGWLLGAGLIGLFELGRRFKN